VYLDETSASAPRGRIAGADARAIVLDRPDKLRRRPLGHPCNFFHGSTVFDYAVVVRVTSRGSVVSTQHSGISEEIACPTSVLSLATPLPLMLTITSPCSGIKQLAHHMHHSRDELFLVYSASSRSNASTCQSVGGVALVVTQPTRAPLWAFPCSTAACSASSGAEVEHEPILIAVLHR
jgi:hypothetical protein